ncbi:hypothetical protein LCGC14_1609430 [marine sediment metagenome]|uniref:Uncharacterized protein n=1 Tax=marine sediment metagenome TaxID=412755 RepID=A0A0F9IVH3_9ZZZZ
MNYLFIPDSKRDVTLSIVGLTTLCLCLVALKIFI